MTYNHFRYSLSALSLVLLLAAPALGNDPLPPQ